VLYVGTSVTEEPAASFFRVEEMNLESPAASVFRMEGDLKSYAPSIFKMYAENFSSQLLPPSSGQKF
jgi:hypothetical protein